MKKNISRLICLLVSTMALSCTDKNNSFSSSNSDCKNSFLFTDSSPSINGYVISSANNGDDFEAGTINSAVSYYDIFRVNKNYSHIFIEDIYDYSSPTVPCESTYDLAIAKRLGFKISEANIQATSTIGKYVVMHGVSGMVGGQLVNLDGTSAATVVISETSFDDLRNNYKYKSIYEEYQTPIVSLEEWLTQCKLLGLVPLVSYVDDTSLNIVKSFFGSDFILYNGKRDRHAGMIMRYQNTLSKEQIISLCEEYGAPLMINVANLSNFESDIDLIDTINEVHKRNCLFGICGCYMSGNDALRGWRCGADFSASSAEINPFYDGDLCDLEGGLSFEGFVTNGIVANNTISLMAGQTVLASANSEKVFLSGNQLEIIFDGKISIWMTGAKRVEGVSSNGTEIIRWSGFAIDQTPSFSITALENTTIRHIKYQAKKM